MTATWQTYVDRCNLNLYQLRNNVEYVTTALSHCFIKIYKMVHDRRIFNVAVPFTTVTLNYLKISHLFHTCLKM